MGESERILVEKAQNDTEAFAELYDLYFPKVFRYVSWRVENQTDAEDLVSEIFSKVLANIRSFRWREGATFSSWIFRIARNVLIDYYRTKPEQVRIDNLPEIESNSILPEEAIARQELFEELQSMIKKLPNSQAEIVTMRFFTGMRNKEIAQVLNISEKTVASNLYRGLRNLHDQFIQRKDKQ
jgi:RNA polymerase sigma-70 factor (ECF subfamily)